jgi:hypothetical protein
MKKYPKQLRKVGNSGLEITPHKGLRVMREREKSVRSVWLLSARGQIDRPLAFTERQSFSRASFPTALGSNGTGFLLAVRRIYAFCFCHSVR